MKCKVSQVKNRFLVTAMLLLLSACGNDADNSPLAIDPKKLSQADFNNVQVEINMQPHLTQTYEGLISVICGPSDGISFYPADAEKSFGADTIRAGRIVFIELEQGRHDVVYRDSSGIYTSALADGGIVKRESNGGLGVWVITYPRTGATETHNLQKVDGELLDLWTSNLPLGLSGPRVSAFVSSCAAT